MWTPKHTKNQLYTPRIKFDLSKSESKIYTKIQNSQSCDHEYYQLNFCNHTSNDTSHEPEFINTNLIAETSMRKISRLSSLQEPQPASSSSKFPFKLGFILMRLLQKKKKNSCSKEKMCGVEVKACVLDHQDMHTAFKPIHGKLYFNLTWHTTCLMYN